MLAFLAERAGTDPDPVALCHRPATRAQLLAGVSGLWSHPDLVVKLMRQRASLAAAHHAWHHAIDPPELPAHVDRAARLLYAARQYQRGFDGDPGGWCPYRAYLQRASARQAAARAERTRPPPRRGKCEAPTALADLLGALLAQRPEV